MENAVFESEQYYGKISKVLEKRLKKCPTVYRLTGDRSRIYFTKQGNNPVRVYNSGTTLIDNFRDKEGERAIHRWKVNLVNEGKDPAIVLKTRQDYGTLLHLLYGKILSGEKTTFKDLNNYIINFGTEVKMTKSYITSLVNSHIEEFKKDLASFITWIQDHNVEPLGIEVMLKSERYRVATALDLIAYVTVREKGFHGEVYKSDSKATGAKKGDPKESFKLVKKLVIIDFKSGKKGFYDKNVLQLLLSRQIFEENFPDMPVAGVFNFAPNDWNSTPSYKFYDQERENKKVDYLRGISTNVFERGLVEFNEVLVKKKKRIISGGVDFSDMSNSLTVRYLSLNEIAEMYYEEAHQEKDVFKLLIKEEKLDDLETFTRYLLKQRMQYLKELGKAIGIRYTRKKDFVKILTQKYKNG